MTISRFVLPNFEHEQQTLEDEVTQTSISIDCEWKVTYNLQIEEKIQHWRYTRKQKDQEP